MNTTVKKGFNILIRAVLAIALVIGFWALGFVFESNHIAWKVLAGVSGGLIVVVAVVNLVLLRRFAGKLAKMNAQEVYDFVIQLQCYSAFA